MQDETSQFAVIIKVVQYSLPLGSSQFLAECLESTSLLVQQWSACTGYHVAGYISHARNISSATYERRARFCRSGILVSAGRFFCKKELDSTLLRIAALTFSRFGLQVPVQASLSNLRLLRHLKFRAI